MVFSATSTVSAILPRMPLSLFLRDLVTKNRATPAIVLGGLPSMSGFSFSDKSLAGYLISSGILALNMVLSIISAGYSLKSTWLKIVFIVLLRHALIWDYVAETYLSISQRGLGFLLALADTKRHRATLASKGFPLRSPWDSILLR